MKSPVLRRAIVRASLAFALGACSSGPAPATDAGTDTGRALDVAAGDVPAGEGGVMCTAQAMCDDGMYCDGAEQCAPGTAGADARGCVHGTPPCDAATQMCGEATRACAALVCTHMSTPDQDGDGHADIACGGDDCADMDAHRFPHNPEVCLVGTASDGSLTRTGAAMVMGVAMTLDPTHDEDCDPTTFASATSHDGDHDGDGFVDVTCANTDRSGMVNHGTDCQDLHAVAGVPAAIMTSVAPIDINPTQTEACDGVDNNCNGVVDEGVQLQFYPDCDGDNYGNPTATAVTGCRAGEFPQCMGHNDVQNNTDCNDGAASVNPGTPEVCDVAMVDENCNGMHNEGCMCVADVPCGLSLPGCPGGIQPCVAGHLQSCSVMPTVLTCYADADGDGYAAAGAASSMACACPVHSTTRAPHDASSQDCNDGAAAVHPGAAEVCNGVDDNCNGSVDEGLGTATYYRDGDGDGYGATSLVTCMAMPGGYVTRGGDCDDGDARAYPGETTYYTTPRAAAGGYDFDCDGSDTIEPAGCGTTMGTCTGTVPTYPFGGHCGAGGYCSSSSCSWVTSPRAVCQERASGIYLPCAEPCR